MAWFYWENIRTRECEQAKKRKQLAEEHNKNEEAMAKGIQDRIDALTENNPDNETIPAPYEPELWGPDDVPQLEGWSKKNEHAPEHKTLWTVYGTGNPKTGAWKEECVDRFFEMLDQYKTHFSSKENTAAKQRNEATMLAYMKDRFNVDPPTAPEKKPAPGPPKPAAAKPIRVYDLDSDFDYHSEEENVDEDESSVESGSEKKMEGGSDKKSGGDEEGSDDGSNA